MAPRPPLARTIQPPIPIPIITPPTYPSDADLAEGTGNRAFTALTTVAGDYIVVEAILEDDSAAIGTLTPSGGGLTYNLQNDSGQAAGGDNRIWQWAALDSSGVSPTITITASNGSARYRARATVVRGSTGPGTGKGFTKTAQSLSVTRQGNNSGMFMAMGDWSAGAVGSPVWTPGGTTVASQQGAGATYIFGRWDDSGNAATVTHGISTPAFTTPSFAVMEMLGTVSSGATPVTGTTDLRWLSYASVSQTSDLRWNSYVTVSQTTDLRWASRSTVSQSLDLRWTSYAQALQTTDLRWLSYARVTGSSDLRWLSYNTISQSSDLRWRSLTAVSQALDLRWTSYGQVVQTSDLRWRSYILVSQTSDLRWRSYVLVSQTSDLRWLSYIQATQTSDLRWRSSELVTGASDLRWLSYAAVAQTCDLRWVSYAQAAQTLDLRWVSLSSIISVSQSMDLRWRSYILTSQTSDLRWRSSILVAQTSDLRWASRVLVSQTNDLRWAVLGVVTGTLDQRWRSYVAVTAANAHLWRVSEQVQRLLDLRWVQLSLIAEVPVPADVRAVLTDRITAYPDSGNVLYGPDGNIIYRSYPTVTANLTEEF